MIECVECEEMIPEHIQTLWNSDDEPVCSRCAEDMPQYDVIEYGSTGTYYGHAEKKLTAWSDMETVSTGTYPTKESAKKRVIELCKLVWKDETPVEEEQI